MVMNTHLDPSPCPLIVSLAHVLIAAVAIAVLVPACKPKPPVVAMRGPDGQVLESPPPPKDEDEQTAKALAAEAASLDASGDRTAAEKKRDLLVELYAGTAAGAEATRLRAEAAAAAGDRQKAIELYERLLFYRPSVERADAIRETYARLLLDVGRFDDAANMLRALFAGARLPQTRSVWACRWPRRWRTQRRNARR